MKQSITVEQVKNITNHGKTFLVRGIGKRAILTHVNPFFVSNSLSVQDIALAAASVANKYGWKKVIVEPDSGYGEYAEAHNTSQHFDYVLGRTSGGKLICHVGNSEPY